MIRFHSRRLLSPEGDASSTPSPEPPSPTPPAPQSAPPPAKPADVPPAARIVVEGRKTEGEVALEIKKRKLETRVSELEDENRELKKVVQPPPPVNAPEKESFLSGFPFD